MPFYILSPQDYEHLATSQYPSELPAFTSLEIAIQEAKSWLGPDFILGEDAEGPVYIVDANGEIQSQIRWQVGRYLVQDKQGSESRPVQNLLLWLLDLLMGCLLSLSNIQERETVLINALQDYSDWTEHMAQKVLGWSSADLEANEAGDWAILEALEAHFAQAKAQERGRDENK